MTFRYILLLTLRYVTLRYVTDEPTQIPDVAVKACFLRILLEVGHNVGGNKSLRTFWMPVEMMDWSLDVRRLPVKCAINKTPNE